ncbi:hypothetical protein ACOK4R_34485 (plasmid) [Pseudomonas fluorescens]|uniref:hypothetical protein n=1 Tax=Pseudomonas fluorescens TaxID=294 RepID=UPI001FD18128|nr:hypothetical protein [Pseudomonas fluorescens]
MAMLLSRLEEFLDDLPIAQAWLPDRFIQPDNSEEAWGNVFNQDKRLKKIADGVRKSPFLKKLGPTGKKVSRLQDAHLLSMFYGSEPMRSMMEDSVQNASSNPPTVSSSVEWLTETLLQANPYEKEAADYLISLFEEDEESGYASHFLVFLTAATDEAFYGSLKPRFMDVADLGVNLLLCTLSPESAYAFLDKHPWLAKKQSRYMDVLRDGLREEEPEDDATRYATELLSLIRCLYDYVSQQREEPSLQGHMKIRSLIRQILAYSEEHGADSFSATMQAEHSQMISLLTKAGDVFRRYKISEALTLWNPLLADIEALPPLRAIDASSDQQISLLETFLANRRQAIMPAQESFRALHSSVGQIERHMEKLSKITQNQDGGLDEILKLNEELLLAKGIAVEKAAQIAPIGASLVKNACTMIQEIDRLKAIPKIDYAARTQELEQQVSGLSSQLSGLQEQASSATQALELANQALEKERERRINQEEAATVARREAHEAKTAMANIGKSMNSQGNCASLPLEPTFVVELMKGSAKLTPESILTTFAALYPQDIVVLESAIKSAKGAYNFEMGSRLASLIQSLVEYLGSVRSGKPDTESRVILGSSYASHESDSVVNNVKLRSQREFSYEGETVLFLSHVGVGRGYGTQHQIRVYFKVINDKMVIAYCGERLDSATTS